MLQAVFSVSVTVFFLLQCLKSLVPGLRELDNTELHRFLKEINVVQLRQYYDSLVEIRQIIQLHNIKH